MYLCYTICFKVFTKHIILTFVYLESTGIVFSQRKAQLLDFVVKTWWNSFYLTQIETNALALLSNIMIYLCLQNHPESCGFGKANLNSTEDYGRGLGNS